FAAEATGSAGAVATSGAGFCIGTAACSAPRHGAQGISVSARGDAEAGASCLGLAESAAALRGGSTAAAVGFGGAAAGTVFTVGWVSGVDAGAAGAVADRSSLPGARIAGISSLDSCGC